MGMMSDEHRRKLSESRKAGLKAGTIIPWNRGKTMPTGFGQKLSRALKGRSLSEEHKKHLSESRKNGMTEGRIIPWNKGLTLEDPRVKKNLTEKAQSTQFKPGPRPDLKGEGNAMWKGGRVKAAQGYIWIKRSDHPYAQSNGYIQEHRLVMEKVLGRYLTPGEVVHHINHQRDDNRPENLMLLPSKGAHTRLHCLERRKTGGLE